MAQVPDQQVAVSVTTQQTSHMRPPILVSMQGKYYQHHAKQGDFIGQSIHAELHAELISFEWC